MSVTKARGKGKRGQLHVFKPELSCRFLVIYLSIIFLARGQKTRRQWRRTGLIGEGLDHVQIEIKHTSGTKETKEKLVQ